MLYKLKATPIIIYQSFLIILPPYECKQIRHPTDTRKHTVQTIYDLFYYTIYDLLLDRYTHYSYSIILLDRYTTYYYYITILFCFTFTHRITRIRHCRTNTNTKHICQTKQPLACKALLQCITLADRITTYYQDTVVNSNNTNTLRGNQHSVIQF